MDDQKLKKVTVQMPESVWVRAKQRALDDRTNLRRLILEGLELRLAEKRRKGGKER